MSQFRMPFSLALENDRLWPKVWSCSVKIQDCGQRHGERSALSDAAARCAGQLAGFVEQFRGLTFATVRGAGHMVWLPRRQLTNTLTARFCGCLCCHDDAVG